MIADPAPIFWESGFLFYGTAIAESLLHHPVMKNSKSHYCRIVAAVLFFGSVAVSSAHPGPPGHYHPDEVDEFDQVAMVTTTAKERHDTNLGGILVLTALGACLGFALIQKDGEIWKGVSADH
jgi:hypothetical protein